MKNDKRTHGLWENSAPAALPTQVLQGTVRADVAIIGGGYTGCSAALHLAEMGRKVALLEADEIGFGGAGRNVGLVNAGLWVMPEQVPAELGEVFGERLLDQLGRAPQMVFDIVERYAIACELRREGTLHCAVGASGAAEIAGRHAQWRRRGADVELLGPEQACKAIGSRAYSGALLDRRAGTIQPLAYVRGLARAAIGIGADIFTASPARSARDTGQGWVIEAGCGSVSAPVVIVATDAYATGPFRQVCQEQVMLPYFNLATQPLPEEIRRSILPGGQGAWDTREVLSSFRFDNAGRLVFGSVGALRGAGTSIHRNWARREMRRLFPPLGKVAFEHEWFGWIGMTDDAIPRFHELARAVYSVSGYNGRGIAPGTTFGRDLARLAAGEIGPDAFSLPLTDVGMPRLRAAKAVAYEVGAQLVHFVGSRI